jgi:hypothetical protein
VVGNSKKIEPMIKSDPIVEEYISLKRHASVNGNVINEIK